MKRVQTIFLICLFLAASLMATFADAAMIRVISRHGKWTVQSDCTSVYAMSSSDSTPYSQGFRTGLGMSCNNGYYGIPKIRVNWAGDLKIGPKSQFKFKLAGNDLSDGWICEKHFCTPKDDDSAAKILEQLLANEGPFAVIITDENKTVLEETIDTTGINGAYQALLEHRR